MFKFRKRNHIFCFIRYGDFWRGVGGDAKLFSQIFDLSRIKNIATPLAAAGRQISLTE
jgi:DNA mismatch repair ATPase MutS